VNYLLTFVETFNKEYLLKQYLQTDKTEPIYRKMYDQTVDAMKKYLVRHSQPIIYFWENYLKVEITPVTFHQRWIIWFALWEEVLHLVQQKDLL
jgi:hypothetical protein